MSLDCRANGFTGDRAGRSHTSPLFDRRDHSLSDGTYSRCYGRPGGKFCRLCCVSLGLAPERLNSMKNEGGRMTA